jgi:hypothetical protein
MSYISAMLCVKGEVEEDAFSESSYAASSAAKRGQKKGSKGKGKGNEGSERDR